MSMEIDPANPGIEEDEEAVIPATDLLVVEENKDLEHAAKTQQARSYQAALLELARKKDNLIICLPTGSGKTFIAMELTKDYLGEAVEKKKKVVFLANTVPLVLQQWKYFQDHISDDAVAKFTGDMNVDFWSREEWKSRIDDCHVMVMTAQVFHDILNKHIRFEDVSLLIFDECHHVGKSHPMNQIMIQYRTIGSEQPTYPLPKVLGLTATIIRGVGKQENIRNDVSEVEKNLCAKAVTYRDYEEVLRNSTDAKLQYIQYNLTTAEPDEQVKSIHLLEPLRQALEFLDVIPNLNGESVEREEELKGVRPEEIYGNKKTFTKEIINFINELVEMYQELGAYCTRLGCLIRLVYLYGKVSTESDEWKLKICRRVITGLSLFLRRAEAIGVSIESVSDKIVKLKEVLERRHPLQVKDDDLLCGLVFVQRRIMAQVLNWYTQDLSRKYPDKFGFLKTSFILGSSGVMDVDEARMSLKRQKDVIDGFHNKKYNLIYATQVLEEGLNVPSCNIVLRFDDITTYSSYVQSMGRGRKQGANFLVFINEKDAVKLKEKYHSFHKYNLILSEHLRQNAIHLDEDEVEIVPDDMEKMYPPFCPGGTHNSPKITMSSSIQVVNHYCQLLQSDRFAVLESVSWWEEAVSEDGIPGFRANVLLPRNACVRSKIVGPVMPTKFLAKRAAHLEVCRKLYSCGALDDNLRPKRKGVSDQVLKCLDLIEVEDRTNGANAKVGTKKRVDWYQKIRPSYFEKLFVDPGVACTVYLLDFQLLNPKNIEKEKVYTFDDKKYFYGIIIQKPLDMIPAFQLEVNLGPIGCSLLDVTYKCQVVLSASQIISLMEFEKYIFYNLLEMNRLSLTELAPSTSTPYLLAPLQKGPDQELTIFWDGVKSIREYENISKYQSPPTEKEIAAMDFTNMDKYVDSIVIPWYRPDLQLYCVSEVLKDKNPSSPFEDPNKFADYVEYYYKKYGLVIKHSKQPLLRCCPIGKQLNFLVLKTDAKPKKRNELKYEEQRNSVLTLVPEFARIFPFPASLFVQTKFLASVLHRINRILLSREIRLSVANHCSWLAALESDRIPKSNFLIKRRTNVSEEEEYESANGPQKKSKYAQPCESGFSEIIFPTPKQTAFQALLERAREAEENRNLPTTSVKTVEPVQKECSAEMENLDYVHPDDIRIDLIVSASSGKTRRKENQENQAPHEPKRSSQNVTVDKDGIFLPNEASKLGLMNIDSIRLDSLDTSFDLTKQPGPSVFKIMEALTLSNAQDSMSQERLELMGDSFLKYCATMHIFCNFVEYDEGQMTSVRSRMVSNAALFTSGKKKKLGEFLSGGIFIPTSSWLPTGLKVPQKFSDMAVELNSNFDIFGGHFTPEQYHEMPLDKLKSECLSRRDVFKDPAHTTLTHTRLGDKNIADCVEALIGAYFTAGGPHAALLFMDAFQLRAPNASGESVKFGEWIQPSPRRETVWIKNHSYARFIPFRQDLENLICYRFKDPWYLVEAFSHPGYTENRGTDSYERLEFLGDAVLDFLVTNHIYQHSNARTPGELTDLRSALVNNVTFGSLTVRYGLHKFILHHSKDLQAAIEKFALSQSSNGHKVTGHFSLLSDFETAVAQDIDVPKMLGDVFESLAGAVFVDCGFKLDVVWKVFYRLMKNEIDEFSQKVPKSPLREIYESYPDSVRIYTNTDVSGVRCGYTLASINVNGKLYYGLGKSNQSAKVAAAKFVMKSLKNIIEA